MKLKAPLMFAKRLIFPKAALKSTARKSVIGAVICIGISVIPLVSVISVSEGMINGMTERIINLSSGHIQFFISRNSEKIKNYKAFTEFKKEMLQVDGVKGVYPEIQTDALCQANGKRTGVFLRGMEESIFLENKGFNEFFKFDEGSPEEFIEESSKNPKTVLIGSKTAEILGVKKGDTVRIITTKERALGVMTPVMTSFKVSGLVSSGYQELDALWVFVPLKSAFSYALPENSRFTFLLNTQDAFSPQLSEVQNKVADSFFDEGIPYRWNEINKNELENFSSTKILLVFIMLMITLVASVNISSALVMLLMEREKEIGILKSLGESSGAISFAFMLTGLATGFAGLLIGLPIAIFVSLNVNRIVGIVETVINIFTQSSVHVMDPQYYLTEVQVSIPVLELFAIIIGVLLLSLLVSIYPSIKAGKQRPLDILRKV